MKIFLVVTILGKVAASIGPLPGSFDACRSHVAAIESEWDERWKEGDLDSSNIMMLEGQRIHRKDVVAQCVKAHERPATDMGDTIRIQ